MVHMRAILLGRQASGLFGNRVQCFISFSSPNVGRGLCVLLFQPLDVATLGNVPQISVSLGSFSFCRVNAVSLLLKLGYIAHLPYN